MLYNILPPLVFFASLGGTIYVVSRVVVRVRRQSFATTARTTHTSSDLTRLLRPSQKSVHVIKNRLALISQIIHQSVVKAKQELKRFRQQRAKPRSLLQKIHRAFTFNSHKLNLAIPDKPEPAQPKPALRIVSQKPPEAKSSPKPPKDTPSAPLATARRHLSASRYHSVERTLVPFLAKHPKNTPAYMLLGKAALGRHDWDEATEVFEQVVSLNPATKGCYAALGYANYKAGKLTKALEALKKAHDADPQNTNIIKRLLSIARHMDNLPLQQSLTARLAELKPAAPAKIESDQKVPPG